MDHPINKFRMIVKQKPDKSFVKEVKYSMDMGATYKMGPKARTTKRQQVEGYNQAKVRRGNATWM